MRSRTSGSLGHTSDLRGRASDWRNPTSSVRPPRHRLQGMTLVELLVALVIGLGVTLAVTSLLIAGENHKRTTTSTNDAEQTGAYGFNALDRLLRGAGSGFAESAYSSDRGVLSCLLTVTSIMPRPIGFPAPFGNFLGGAPGNLRVAPALIAANQSPDGLSDVLVVMGGSGSAGGVSRQVTGAAGATSLVLDNVIGFANSDLALLSQSGTTNCLIEEVASITGTTTLNVGGATYLTPGPSTAPLSSFAGSTNTYVTPLGNAGANNLQFMLIGVDANHTLYSYDLLRNQSLVQSPGSADTSQPMADQVYQIHAIYGIDNNGNGTQDAWAGPSDANYDIVSVMTHAATIKKIVAVRVGMVVRGEYYDKHMVGGVLTPVSPSSYTLFSGLTNGAGTSLQQTVSLSADDQQYRYRVFEFTVPLRNMIVLAGGP